MGRKDAAALNKLLKESGYSEKTIAAILKYYGQDKAAKDKSQLFKN